MMKKLLLILPLFLLLFVACVDENGQKKEEGIIKNGEKDGLWTEWWQQNGQKRVETTYKGSVG